MDSKDIIVQHRQLYEALEIPPNIQKHMLDVAAVLAWISDHWKGPAIDKDLLIAAGLVHDLGNIAKADFNWSGQQALMGDEWQRREHWKKVQQQLFEKHGTKHHGVLTKSMLAEVHASKAVMDLCTNTGFHQNVNVAASDNWHAKILVYADCRVSPHGVRSLPERIAEAKKRYLSHQDHEGFSEAGATAQEAAIFEIQKQVEQHLTKPASAITDESIAAYGEQLAISARHTR